MGEDFGAGNPLSTKILLDFSESQRMANEFDAVIDRIATSFANMSSAVKGINIDIGKKISQAMRSLESGGTAATFDVAVGDKLKARIESAITRHVQTRPIRITDPENLQKFNLSLSAKQWEYIRKRVQSKLVGSLQEMARSVDKFTADPIVLSPQHMTMIRNAFKARLSEAINQNMVITWADKAKAQPFTLDLSGDAIAPIMAAFRTQLLKQLSDPNIFQFGAVQPVQIDSKVMQDAVERIRAALGNIDEYLRVDTVALGQLPNIDKSLASFRAHMERIVTDFLELNKQIEGMGAVRKEDDVAAIKNSIISLRKNIVIKAGEFIQNLSNAAGAVKAGKAETTQVTAFLNMFADMMNQQVIRQIEEYKAVFLGALGAQEISAEGKKAFVAGLRHLQITIIQAVEVALKSVSATEVKFDQAALNKVLKGWSAILTQQLSDQTAAGLLALSKGYLIANQEVISAITKTVTIATTTALGTAGKGEQIRTAPSPEAIRSNIVPQLSKLVDDLLANLIIDTVKGSKAFKIQVNPAGLERVQAQVSAFLQKQVDSMLVSLSATTQVAAPSIDTKAVEAVLRTEANALLHLIVAQVQEFVTNYRKLMGAGDPIKMSAEDSRRLKAAMSQVLNVVIDNVVASLKTALTNFVATKDSQAILRGKIKNAIDQALLAVEFKITPGIPAVLDTAVKEGIKKVQQAVRQAVGSWVASPNLLVGGLEQKGIFSGINQPDLISDVNRPTTGFYTHPNVIDLQREGFKDLPQGIPIALRQDKAVLQDHPWEKEGHLGTATVGMTQGTTRGLDTNLPEHKAYIDQLRQTAAQAGIKNIDEFVMNNLRGRGVQWVQGLDTMQVLDAGMLNVESVASQANKSVRDTIDRHVTRASDLRAQGVDWDEVRNKASDAADRLTGQQAGFIKEEVLRRVGKMQATEGVPQQAPDLGQTMLRDAEIAAAHVRKQASVQAFDVQADMGKVAATLNRAVQDYIARMNEAILAAQKGQNFMVPLSQVHAQTRAALARTAGMSVSDYRQAHPILQGNEMMTSVMNENMKVVLAKFNSALQNAISRNISEYIMALSKAQVKPNLEPVDYLMGKMQTLQVEIVKKVKQILDAQFKALSSELRGMVVAPASIGAYTPPAVAARQIVRGAAAAQAKAGAVVAVGGGIPAAIAAAPPTAPARAFAREQGAIIGAGIPLEHKVAQFDRSMTNMFNYMVAGMIYGMPLMALRQAFESAKQFDYELMKARQNFLVKDADMRETALRRVRMRYEQAGELGDYGITEAQYRDPVFLEKQVEVERKRIRDMMTEGVVRPLQGLAIHYGLDQQDVGRVWHIASRAIADPHEALAMTAAITKLTAYERETKPEDFAKGMEAIKAQWGLTGNDADWVANMMIQTATMSPATAADLSHTMGRASAIFAQNMPDRTLEEGIATSLALSGLFVQATARSGKEAGTFFRRVFQAPFEPGVATYLEDMAAHNHKLAMLSPYVREPLPTGGYARRQKDGVEMFLDIIEGLRHLDDFHQKDLIAKVFKRHHMGSGVALQALVEDLQNITQIADFEGYVERIRGVKPEDINRMVYGMMGTWDYRVQKVRSVWQTATFEVFDDLKKEFVSVSNYLVAFLRAIKENASKITELLTLAAQYGMAQFAVGAWDRMKQRGLEDMYQHNRGVMGVEERILGTRGTNLADDFRVQEGLLGGVVTRREDAEQRLAQKTQAFVTVDKQFKDFKDTYDTKVMDAVEERAVTQGMIQTYGQRSVLQHEVAAIDTELKGIVAEEAAITGSMSQLAGELQEVNNQMTGLSKRSQLMDIAFAEMGMRGSAVEGKMNSLGASMLAGTTSLNAYEAELKGLAGQAGVSQTSLGTLRTRVDELTARFLAGKLSVSSYVTQLNQLERTALLGTLGVPEGKAQTARGSDLLNTVIAGSMARHGFQGVSVIQGMKQSMQNLLVGGLPAIGARLSGANIKAGASGMVNRAWTSTVASLYGIKTAIAGFAAQIPMIVATMAGMTVAMDVAAAQALTSYEFQENQVNRYEKSIASWTRVEERFRNRAGLGDHLAALGGSIYGVAAGAVGGLGALFGGTGVPFGDMFAIMDIVRSAQGEEREKKLEERFGLEAKEFEAYEARRKAELDWLYNNPTLDLTGDGRRDDTTKRRWDEVETLEEGQQMISRITEDLQEGLGELQAEYTLGSTKRLLRGMREDSDELRQLMDDFLKNSIEITQDAITEIKGRQAIIEEHVPFYTENDAWRHMEQEKIKQQVSLAELEMQRRENFLAEQNQIVGEADRRRALGQADWSIKRSQLILGGAFEDSAAVRALETKAIRADNKNIYNAIKELTAFMNELQKGDFKREEVLLQIRQLEVEANDNLVRIQELSRMNQGTFNLPSGITPITYWEATTRGATHRNVTVRSGDVVVNINIDNMGGGAEAANRLGEIVAKTVRNQATELTRQNRAYGY